jgi:hypothetical protein
MQRDLFLHHNVLAIAGAYLASNSINIEEYFTGMKEAEA